MKFRIVTPASTAARTGNSVTAIRWRNLLKELGHEALVTDRYDDETCDVLIVMHACKNADVVRRSHAKFPERPIILALTGTDVYGDLGHDPAAQEALRTATRVVVLQRMALSALPRDARKKTHVIYQSALVERPENPASQEGFRICVIANLRSVKDPLLTAKAARLVRPTSQVRVTHYGEPLDEELARSADEESRANPRYSWEGAVPQRRALETLSESHLFVSTSKAEGGSNAVSEAIAAGVPIVATEIPGTVGVLGAQHAGYFPVGDARALANLIDRAERDQDFYRTLRAGSLRLRDLVKPGREQDDWKELIAKLK